MYMKSLFFRFCLVACIPLFIVACLGSEKLSGNEFLIEGNISGTEDGAVIMLFRNEDGFGTFLSQDTLKNGRFMFKKEAVSDLERMFIFCPSEGYPNESLSLWVTPGKKIKISGKDKLLHLWEVKSAVPYQKEENRYANKSRNIIKEMVKLNLEIYDLQTKAKTASSNDEALAYRMAIDSLGVINTSLKIKEFLLYMDIMTEADISPVWFEKMSIITNRLRNSNNFDELRKKAEELYDKMSEKDKNTPEGYQITANLFPPLVVEVGDDMVDTDFFDISGNTKHLSNYSGKYLFLDFWSSGCGPCIMAFPELKEIYETCSENLTIISISFDTDAKWKAAVTEHDIPWVNIRDPKAWGGLAANYGVNGIPFYVIISPEGKVVDKWFGFRNGYIKEKVNKNIK